MPNSDIRTNDPHDLNRFLLAQLEDFDTALSEIASGKKRSHWTWFIFPQFDGLGFSQTTKHFAIKNLEEAKAYLEHPILGPRLLACAEAVIEIQGRTAHESLLQNPLTENTRMNCSPILKRLFNARAVTTAVFLS